MSFLPGKAADALLKIGDLQAIPKIVQQAEWDTYQPCPCGSGKKFKKRCASN